MNKLGSSAVKVSLFAVVVPLIDLDPVEARAARNLFRLRGAPMWILLILSFQILKVCLG